MLASFAELGYTVDDDNLEINYRGPGAETKNGDIYYRHSFWFDSIYPIESVIDTFVPIYRGNKYVDDSGKRHACYKLNTITRVFMVTLDEDGGVKTPWFFRFTSATKWRNAFSQMPFELDNFIQKTKIKPQYDFEGFIGVEVESLYERR